VRICSATTGAGADAVVGDASDEELITNGGDDHADRQRRR
jgi:hypothetical protein